MANRPAPEVPDFLTVEEAARVLRVGRTAAYGLTRAWRETGGREGLPVVRFGRLLRVPRTALEEMTGGPISTETVIKQAAPSAPRPEPEIAEPIHSEFPRPARRRHSRPRPAPPNQTTLPLT